MSKEAKPIAAAVPAPTQAVRVIRNVLHYPGGYAKKDDVVVLPKAQAEEYIKAGYVAAVPAK